MIVDTVLDALSDIGINKIQFVALISVGAAYMKNATMHLVAVAARLIHPTYRAHVLHLCADCIGQISFD